ncbi:MAG TPA: enoyl-CoA hydratase-related protein [Actinomycetes bacterium]|nr:enoyl-CoA hydratase-related protein [Actinomycetes bacterium]
MSLSVRRDGAATWITLERPDALNALDGPVKEALVGALREAADDPGVRAVALTGSGRAFCVGQDLRELEDGYRKGRAADFADALERHYVPICRLLAEMPKPTVAVVNGVAAGAGVSLALACDLRLSSSTARWRLAFSGIGLVPDAGSTWHLPRLVGLSRAMEMALLGDWVDADQALAFGLVNRVWPAEDLQREAEAAVAALAAGPTLALGRTKALFRDHLGTDLAGALAGETEAQVAAGQTKDHLEGVTAFLEKRPPSFQGA